MILEEGYDEMILDQKQKCRCLWRKGGEKKRRNN